MGQGPCMGLCGQHMLIPDQASQGTMWGCCHQRAAVGYRKGVPIYHAPHLPSPWQHSRVKQLKAFPGHQQGSKLHAYLNWGAITVLKTWT